MVWKDRILALKGSVARQEARVMAQKADELVGGPADAELARAAAGGDGQAFDELYRRHADAAWRVAYAVTGNREDAADAVAEAFTRMLTALNAGRLADLDRFRPYLLATTRNAAIDVLRRTGRVHPTDTELADPAGPGTLGPSERLLEGLDSALVAAAFRSLPERWRSVLWLTEVEGMAPAEAAGLLGLSANGAAQLAVRARAGLRQRFLQAHLRADVDRECRFTVERLGAYVGGGLSPRDIAKVDQHLADCRACSARRAELEEVGTALRRVAAPLPLALGPLAWRHWLNSLRAASRTKRPLIPVGAQRTLTGASFGILGLGIIGASIIGQPSLGSTARPRPAGAVPVGQSPVAVEEARAATQAPPGPLALVPAPLPAPAGTGASGAPAAAGPVGAVAASGPSPSSAGPTTGTGTSPAGNPVQPVVPQGSGGAVQMSAQINLTRSTGATVNAGTQNTGISSTGVPPTDTTPAPSGSVSVTTPVTSTTVTTPTVPVP
jgi:RNA polymerase sigma factor (sigma-70 family)